MQLKGSFRKLMVRMKRRYEQRTHLSPSTFSFSYFEWEIAWTVSGVGFYPDSVIDTIPIHGQNRKIQMKNSSCKTTESLSKSQQHLIFNNHLSCLASYTRPNAMSIHTADGQFSGRDELQKWFQNKNQQMDSKNNEQPRKCFAFENANGWNDGRRGYPRPMITMHRGDIKLLINHLNMFRYWHLASGMYGILEKQVFKQRKEHVGENGEKCHVVLLNRSKKWKFEKEKPTRKWLSYSTRCVSKMFKMSFERIWWRAEQTDNTDRCKWHRNGTDRVNGTEHTLQQTSISIKLHTKWKKKKNCVCNWISFKM